jgi:sugar phosphate isomerase/epimerase
MTCEEIEKLRKAIKIMKKTMEEMEKEGIDVATLYVTMAIIMAKIEKMANLPKNERDEAFKVAREMVDEIDMEMINQ